MKENRIKNQEELDTKQNSLVRRFRRQNTKQYFVSYKDTRGVKIHKLIKWETETADNNGMTTNDNTIRRQDIKQNKTQVSK